MLDAITQDVRYAIRSFRTSPGFAAVAILSLALGIGANTAIFSLIDAVMLKSLPVRHPEELLQVTMDRPLIFSNPIWEQIRDRQDVFSAIFADGGWPFNLAVGGEVRHAKGGFVSGQYFETLGVRAVLGRILAPADDRRGCPGAAVLSYGFWQREYGGRAGVLGNTISLDNHPIPIVGVTEPGFTGIDVGSTIDVLVPLCSEKIIHGETSILDWNAAPGNYDALVRWLRIIGRPKPGVSARQATARLKTLAPEIYKATVPRHWRAADQARYLKHTLNTEPVANGVSYIRRQYRQALFVLMTIVGVVLLIACVNIANLLLARGTGRQREIAIRMALGCGRGRLIRQLLTESLLLSLIGAALGILLARASTSLLVRYLNVFLDLTPDVRVLAFTAAIAILTGLLFGIAPAWRGTRVQPQSAMKANSRSVIEGGQLGLGKVFGLGKVLVMSQVALSLLLVVGAGLMLSTFWTLTSLGAGFGQLLLVDVDLRNGNYAIERKRAVYREMLERLRALPGVRSASASDPSPLCGCWIDNDLVIEGYAANATVRPIQVSDRYFETLGIAIVAGRDFNNRDTPTSPRVAIINQTMATKYFGEADPLGRHYRVRRGDKLSDPVEIVGIVKDSKTSSLRDEIFPTVYIALSQDEPYPQRVLELRPAAVPPTVLIAAVKSAIAAIDRNVSLEFTTLSTKVDKSLARERLLATLSGFFGALALLLATIGLYGVMSYNLARRRNEIGIRMALGAEQAQVLGMVLRELALLIGIGIAAGLAAAVATTRFLASFLYGLQPNDPLTLFLAAATLAGVGAFAGYLPARRASCLDPMTALREE